MQGDIILITGPETNVTIEKCTTPNVTLVFDKAIVVKLDFCMAVNHLALQKYSMLKCSHRGEKKVPCIRFIGKRLRGFFPVTTFIQRR